MRRAQGSLCCVAVHGRGEPQQTLIDCAFIFHRPASDKRTQCLSAECQSVVPGACPSSDKPAARISNTYLIVVALTIIKCLRMYVVALPTHPIVSTSLSLALVGLPPAACRVLRLTSRLPSSARLVISAHKEQRQALGGLHTCVNRLGPAAAELLLPLRGMWHAGVNDGLIMDELGAGKKK